MTETQRDNITGYPQGLPLRGERIYLRRPTMDDAQRVFQWERDDEVWRYDPRRPFSNSLAEFVPIFERNYIRGNGRQFWFVIEDEQHIPIGTITYFNISSPSLDWCLSMQRPPWPIILPAGPLPKPTLSRSARSTIPVVR